MPMTNPSLRLFLGLVISIAVLPSPSLFAQNLDSDMGERLYKLDAESVFLLYAQSSNGSFVAQGSGFLISGQIIVTNAHVANVCKIFLVLGPAKIPTVLESIDNFHDIAFLKSSIELTAKALAFSSTTPTPGEKIFVIGNPEGLEKTISEGLISGIRNLDGRELLQLTAAISHGSSGGPVLDAQGNVVGIAVGSLQEGQNLNFAVPASSVRDFMKAGKTTAPVSVRTILERIRKLEDAQKLETYSSDKTSAWQREQTEIVKLLREALDDAGTDDKSLLQVGEVPGHENPELAIEAAQRTINIKSSPDAQLILAKALYSNWLFSPASNKDKVSLVASEHAARMAVSSSQKPTQDAYYTLAEILSGKGSYIEAQRTYKLALANDSVPTDEDMRASIFRGLIECSSNLNNVSEAEQ